MKKRKQNEFLYAITITTPYTYTELERAFKRLKSYDLVLHAANLAMWYGTGLFDLVDVMEKTINSEVFEFY